ncbi:MAG: ABC transporter permease subunit [SAR324 cluster bacterium]|nr:ABC transporter permease subunit [SAR324 cluster bacterium]
MQSFQFEFQVMLDSLPLLLEGAKLTFVITLLGCGFGFILGAFFGVLRSLESFWPRKIAGFYIEIIRGTPLMVQVMFLYFGLPLALGVRMPPLAAGIAAIAVNAGAYIAEVVRGAIEGVPKGQMEAARSIGLSKSQAMIYVIWPQAFRAMIPPLGNQFIISLKDTSLLVVIGVGELTRTGQEVISVNFRAFEVWLTVALLYLCLTLGISQLLRFLERRFKVAG